MTSGQRADASDDDLLELWAERRRTAEAAAARADDLAARAAARAAEAIAEASRAAQEAEAAAEVATRAAEEAEAVAVVEAAARDAVQRRARVRSDPAGSGTPDADADTVALTVVDDRPPAPPAPPLVTAPPTSTTPSPSAGRGAHAAPDPDDTSGPARRTAGTQDEGVPEPLPVDEAVAIVGGSAVAGGGRRRAVRDVDAATSDLRASGTRTPDAATTVVLPIEPMRGIAETPAAPTTPATPAAPAVPAEPSSGAGTGAAAPVPGRPRSHRARRRRGPRPVVVASVVGIVLAGAATAALVGGGSPTATVVPAADDSATTSVPVPTRPDEPLADPAAPRAVAFLDAMRAAAVPVSGTGQAETEAAAVLCEQLGRGVEAGALVQTLPAVLPTVAAPQAPQVVALAQEHYC